AAPLPEVNVDTDKIIPKQYLKTIERTGLGRGLFSELRYNDDGTENEDFVLNKSQYRNAKILVAGDNFGCGSSREHAPWALLDYGIKVVISTSFADIFYNNCFKNGMLPIVLDEKEVSLLMEETERGSNATLTVDLESQDITTSDGNKINFTIDKFLKHCLLNGLDDIALTLEKNSEIGSYEDKIKSQRPWL
ncbi:MAG: 3-isopropylmalate dehydratase small subunit, partial [Pseudomonadota bacterium]|nr:3-isopropylmalate dehydratase small subunit [Pseudomonadota bacterium]